MSQRLLIASTNPGKVAEFRRLLSDLPLEVIGLESLPAPLPAPAETGHTFAANALLKAQYYFSHTGLLALADDSGLEVDALGGAPGIYSARYAGANATDAERIVRLLDELKNVPDEQRTARFRCAIALVGVIGAGPETEVFEGVCEGLITREPRGVKGFGYDPVFLDAQLQRTFAELPPEEKAARSHRGRALAAALEFLQQRLKS
ncbi:MAG: RdgB/HAM1 family non-canonical purine NTP pyrophosphatase [Blastocatellia bacterium]